MNRILFILCTVLVLASAAAGAETPFTGRSHITTEHFQIIFEHHDERYAQEIAQYADEVLKELSDILGYMPSETIPVAIAGRTALANGFYSPMPHSITLFVTSPSTRFLGSRTSDWLYSLFVHELIHYVHLTEPKGPPRLLAPIFGPDIKAMNTAFMPGWWIEGIATYGETVFADGGRGEDPRFSMFWRAPLLEDRMWSFSQSAYQSAYPPSGRIYVSGYIMIDYLIERFGPDVFSDINSRFVRFPFFGMSYSIGRTVGVSGRQLFADMVESLKVEAFSDLPEEQGEPFSPERTGNYHLPRPTQEGWIGWVTELGSLPAVSRYPGSGLRPDVLAHVSLTDQFSLDVTPDGSAALAAVYWEDQTHSASSFMSPVSYSDLHLIDLDSGSTRQLTIRSRLYHPTISPEGSWAAAVERVGTRYRLAGIDLSSGETHVIYENPQGSVYEPVFAKDGSSIIAVEVIRGMAALIEVDFDGTKRELWPHADEAVFAPRTQDDRSILFSSDRSGTLDLYQYRMDTQTAKRLLQDPAGVLGADILGDELVYSTYRSSGHALRSMHLSSLDPVSAEAPAAASFPDEQDEREYAPYEVKKYYDFPRPGLWLPIPIFESDGSIAPGGTAMLTSVLGMHGVSLTAGWNISDSLPIIQASYTYTPGWGMLSLSGEMNSLRMNSQQQWEREHGLSASLTLPLRQSVGMTPRWLISSSFLGGYRHSSTSDTLFIVSQVGYQRHYLQPRGAFFGGTSASVFGGTETVIRIRSNDVFMYPFVRTSAQVRLPWANHVIRTEADAVAAAGSLFSSQERFLLPRGNPSWGVAQWNRNVHAKLKGTLMYRIPFGNFDIPILFGGLIGAGASVFAQSALYLETDGVSWEEDIYGGIEIAADLGFAALSRLRPSVGVTVGLLSGKYKVYADLSIAPLFSGLRSAEATIQR